MAGTNKQELRVWYFCASLLAFGTVAAAVVAATAEAPADQPFQIPWFVFAVAFVVTEWLDVDIEVKREAQTLTFTEAPLLLGLLLADPQELILVRVLAAAAAVAVIRRPPLVKFVFNTGQFALQAAAAVVAYHLILGSHSAVDPVGWFAALVAVSVAFAVSAVTVTTVMVLAGAKPTLRSQSLVIGVGWVAALAGGTVALGAAATLWRDGRSWVLLVIIGAALGYFFVAFIRIRERHQSLATLHGFTTSVAEAIDVDDLGERVVTGIAALLRARRVILLLPGDRNTVRVVDTADGTLTIEPAHVVTELEWVMASSSQREGGAFRTRSIAGLPLLSDQVVSVPLPLPERPGLVILDGRLSNARAFDDEDVQLLETAAGHAASAIHNAQLVNELREEATFRAHQALHDDVTDLPNSRGLAETLQLPLALGNRLALLTIRLDSLREVNETLGRAMGDELLTQAAARLAPLAEERWCAKTASDEFTVAVRGGNDEAEEMAARIIEAFEAPVQCEDVALAVTAGIGVVLAPDHGRETEILLRRASLAASRSRVEGTRVTVWAADRDPYDPQRLAIAADLRDAIPAGELQVHFQPQVDIDSGLVIAAEALVRWRHPRLGELRPDQFIAAAEYTGAIDALTEFVLSVAARTCAGWRAQGWDLDVSVNLSARNLANVAFAATVERVLEETGLAPSALTLELTESSIMSEAAEAMVTIEAIHALGVSLSIDDFGTGYSSLAHLRKLPLSEIKIDKSFVFELTTNHHDEAIVRSMVSLGHHLGLTVVVEGVETVEVRRRLAELGADRIQGYLLSRPMPVHAFEQWIADRPVRMADLSASEAQDRTPREADDRER